MMPASPSPPTPLFLLIRVQCVSMVSTATEKIPCILLNLNIQTNRTAGSLNKEFKIEFAVHHKLILHQVLLFLSGISINDLLLHDQLCDTFQ